MRSSLNPNQVIQLALFHPPLRSPSWEQLPPETRRQTVRLLAQVLCEQVASAELNLRLMRKLTGQ